MVSLHLLVQINFSFVQTKPREVRWQSPVCHSCCPQHTFYKIISKYCRNSSGVFSHKIFTSEDSFESNKWLAAGCSLALISTQNYEKSSKTLKSPSATSTQLLNPFRDGDSSISLGSPFQCLKSSQWRNCLYPIVYIQEILNIQPKHPPAQVHLQIIGLIPLPTK